MKKTLLTLLGTSTLVLGGVDASVLKETPLERVETIKNERVEVRQVGNVVETTMPWKGETGLKIKVDMGEPTLPERVADKRKKEVVTEVLGDGFKIDFLLNEKPDTNVFCQTIEGAENYDFFYQPFLTQEEIDEGAERPENVEGSYAVYHKTLANHRIGGVNYETGKAWHIYRPQVWSLSSSSTKEWADLSFENNELCVTVPQKFLDEAVYPVRVDPTFGYTSVGASTSAIAQASVPRSWRKGKAYNLAEAGTTDSIHVSLASASSDTVTITAYINREDAVADSHAEVVAVESDKILSTSQAFFTFTASSESLSADDYVLNVLADAEDGNATIAADTGGASGNVYSEFAEGVGGYATMKESPWTEVESISTTEYSIYATYTAEAPAPESTTTPQTTISGNTAITGNAVVQ
jgi:hypothetical protein